MSQALYRKYRPKGWSEVIGQDHIVQTLRNAIAADRVGHAYLFAGPRGTGKTTLARILAKAVNCLDRDPTQHPCNDCKNCRAVNENRFFDLIEMDAASNTGVEDVRDLRDKIGFSPSQGGFKVYIVDEVHMLSTPAFNALLKTLEEPPPHAIFVLATTEIHKIPATVLSRCQRHEFRRIPVAEILISLNRIVESESIQADEDALLLIARQATGSIRDAQSLLDQLSSIGSRITLELTQAVLGTATSQVVFDLMNAIRSQNAGAGLDALHSAIDSGADPRTLARQIVEYLRSLMMIQMGNRDQVETINDTKERMDQDAKAFSSSDVLRMMKLFNHAASDTRGGWQPSLSLEIALAQAFEPEPRDPPQSQSSTSGPIGSPPSAQTRQQPKTVSANSTRPGQEHPALSSLRDDTKLYPKAKPDVRKAEASQIDTLLAHQESTSLDLIQVVKAWKEIRAAIKPMHPGVEALLNSCKPVDMRGDELLLGFQSDTVRALMDKSENLEAARKAIAEVLGATLRIKCVVINTRGNLPPNLSADGMVATALDHGGEIVDFQD